MLILIMSGMCFITCICCLIIKLLFDYCSEETSGEIKHIEVVTKCGLDDMMHDCYDYIYEYNDDKRKLHQGKIIQADRVKRFSIGDKICVRYLKFLPKISVTNYLGLKSFCVFMTLMTLFMAVVLIIIWKFVS